MQRWLHWFWGGGEKFGPSPPGPLSHGVGEGESGATGTFWACGGGPALTPVSRKRDSAPSPNPGRGVRGESGDRAI